MSILITLCCRGGSKGIPGKNIRIINGKPLLAMSIEIAQKFAANHNNVVIVLSTESNEIKEVARRYGIVSSYIRPEWLATDEAGKLETIRDVMDYSEDQAGMRFDYILDLDVTSPLRNVPDLEAAFELLKNDSQAANIFSVNPSHRNPYFNMVERQENGYYGLVKTGSFLTRQSAPAVYDMNASFYFYRRKFFEVTPLKMITDTSMVYVMPHICFDLDHPHDFEFMEYLLVNNKLGFSF